MISSIQAKYPTIRIYEPPPDISDIALVYATEKIDGEVSVYVISEVGIDKIFLFVKKDEVEAKIIINSYWRSLRKSKNKK